MTFLQGDMGSPGPAGAAGPPGKPVSVNTTLHYTVLDGKIMHFMEDMLYFQRSNLECIEVSKWDFMVGSNVFPGGRGLHYWGRRSHFYYYSQWRTD